MTFQMGTVVLVVQAAGAALSSIIQLKRAARVVAPWWPRIFLTSAGMSTGLVAFPFFIFFVTSSNLLDGNWWHRSRDQISTLDRWVVKFLAADFGEVITPSTEDGGWVSGELMIFVLHVLD